MIVLDITTFSGHLHPLVVHLPIGFILLGVVFDLAAYTKKYTNLKAAVPVALLMGFISAVLACIFGYVLSLSGEYDYGVLRSHQYSGIVLAISLGILYLMRTGIGKKLPRFNNTMFTVILLGITMLMTYSGHLGASLTHGHDYLSFQTLTSRLREKPTSLDSAMIFEDVVQPIIQNKCLQCHREGKAKGNLSVETLQSLMKGGKNGPAVVAGNSAESELYKRITLDPDNKDFMPKDGKTPLTRQETRIIKWWIEKAGATSKKRMVELDSTISIRPHVASYLGIGGIAAPEQEEGGYTQMINPDIPLLTDTVHISNLRKKGVMVRYMLKKPLMLDITVPAGSGIKAADFKAAIQPLAKIFPTGLEVRAIAWTTTIELETKRKPTSIILDPYMTTLFEAKLVEIKSR